MNKIMVVVVVVIIIVYPSNYKNKTKIYSKKYNPFKTKTYNYKKISNSSRKTKIYNFWNKMLKIISKLL